MFLIYGTYTNYNDVDAWVLGYVETELDAKDAVKKLENHLEKLMKHATSVENLLGGYEDKKLVCDLIVGEVVCGDVLKTILDNSGMLEMNYRYLISVTYKYIKLESYLKMQGKNLIYS